MYSHNLRFNLLNFYSISIRIYDLSGREVYASGKNLAYEIDLSFLKSDMYLLKIDTVKGIHVYKIEKQ